MSEFVYDEPSFTDDTFTATGTVSNTANQRESGYILNESMFNGYFDSSLTCDYYVFASHGIWTETE